MPICWAHMGEEILDGILIHILLYLLRLCDYLYCIIIRVYNIIYPKILLNICHRSLKTHRVLCLMKSILFNLTINFTV